VKINGKHAMKLLPKRLYIGIGGYFGSCYSVHLEKGHLTYTHQKEGTRFPETRESVSEKIQPTQKRWQAFRAALDRLNVWCWQEHYLDPGVCDGTQWSLKIAYPDKAVISGGSNSFPGRNGEALSLTAQRNEKTFARFCCAVALLVGREFQ
jgi:hypothetical protein